MPFTFLLGLGIFSVGILWLVDVDKSRIECRKYLEGEATKMYSMSDSVNGSGYTSWRGENGGQHQEDELGTDKD